MATRSSITMRQVQERIRIHESILWRHGFLQLLEGPGTLDDVRRMAPRLAFFVLAFQDVTRLAHRRSSDPELRAMSRDHQLEDQGHDRWYLADLERFGISCTIDWLFSAEHESTRDVAYALVSEVNRAKDDRSRLAVVLALEAIGAGFFRRIIGFLERIGGTEGLRYFARSHALVESRHGVFEEANRSRLEALDVPADAVDEVLGAVDLTFRVMTRLADDLEAAILDRREEHAASV
jgi:hypothetical protein